MEVPEDENNKKLVAVCLLSNFKNGICDLLWLVIVRY